MGGEGGHFERNVCWGGVGGGSKRGWVGLGDHVWVWVGRGWDGCFGEVAGGGPLLLVEEVSFCGGGGGMRGWGCAALAPHRLFFPPLFF